MYTNFKHHSQHDLDNELAKSINVNKLLLTAALEDTYKIFEQKKSLFKHIHQTALNTFKKDENISLEQLKTKIITLFNLNDLHIDLYLIDKNYLITDATFKKDIGLDFKNLPDAKMYLDQAAQDNEIHIADNVSIDYMDSTIKIYTYARIDDEKYLEIAFIDPYIYKNFRQRVSDISKSTENKISLFRIINTSSNEEYYEDILSNENIQNKEAWIDSLKKFPVNSATTDKIINAKRQNQIIKTNKDFKEVTVNAYIPLLSRENDSSLVYNNFVMKLEIDISEHLTLWEENGKLFILLILILLMLMIILYFFIKKNFYIPITTITKSFEDEVKIDDPSLLMKKDEFGILVEKYNTLYVKLQHQIEKNQHLLEENKLFIADMVHQIRTPLSVIMTNTSLIEMKSKSQVSSYLMQINSAINMLSNSYEDLSYIISNDTLEYKAIEINLSHFLDQRIDFFEVIAQANDKTISTHIANDLKITMNDIELERLIDNNLSNAINHSYDKSEIKITLEKSNSDIVLQFISKGKNIRDVSRLFDKNYTESFGAKRSLGLGLNMVKTICEKNNILYSAHSEDNTNTFTYIFRA